MARLRLLTGCMLIGSLVAGCDCDDCPKDDCVDAGTDIPYSPTDMGTDTATPTDTAAPATDTEVKTDTDVPEPSTVAVILTPSYATIITMDQTVQFAATCVYDNGVTEDCTDEATWSSSDMTIATMTASGMAAAVNNGETEITATVGSVISTAALLSIDLGAICEDVTIEGASALPMGMGAQLSAYCTMENGDIVDVIDSPSLTWQTDYATIATVSDTGYMQAVAMGTAAVTATYANPNATNVLGTHSLNVITAQVAGIQVSPSPPDNLPVGLAQDFTAQCEYTDQTIGGCPLDLTWYTNDADIASIDEGGTVIGLVPGTTDISAFVVTILGDSVLSDPVPLTVVDPVITAVEVTPSIATIAVGETRPFIANCTLSDGQITDCTQTATWSSSEAANASISATGVVTGILQGDTVIAATIDGIAANAVPVTIFSCDSVLWFPDENLKAAVRNANGVDTGDIISPPIKGITTLNAVGDGISDLTGIQCFQSLEVLSLQNNQISDIAPLSTQTTLIELNLFNNNLTDISPLSGLTNLRKLHLFRNAISDVTPLGTLTALTDLNLQSNAVSDVSAIGALTTMKTLKLNDNAIEEISALGSLTNLDLLNVAENNLTDISGIGTLTGLRFLYLYSNGISDISSLSTLTSLRGVDLKINNISNIYPLAQNSGIAAGDTVDLNDNPINCNDSATSDAITELETRGVDLSYACVGEDDAGVDAGYDGGE